MSRATAALVAAMMIVAGCATPPPTTPNPTGTPVAASSTPAPPSPTASPPPTPGNTSGPPPPESFVAAVDNAWYPLAPGTTLRYEGTIDGTDAVDTFEVTSETKVISGITCVVVRDTVTIDGMLAELTDDWFAQDRDGNVWYFGEATAEYEDGQVVSTEGSWQHGVDGATAGIFMPADPAVGDSFAQESYPGQAEDYFVVLFVGVEVTVPFGTFGDALVTGEWTPLEPDVLGEKIYVRDVGLVKEFDVTGGDERFELVSVALP